MDNPNRVKISRKAKASIQKSADNTPARKPAVKSANTSDITRNIETNHHSQTPQNRPETSIGNNDTGIQSTHFQSSQTVTEHYSSDFHAGSESAFIPDKSISYTSPQPSQSIAQSDIGQPIQTERKSQVSIKDDNAAFPVSETSATTAWSDIGKTIQTERRSQISIKNDNAAFPVSETSATAAWSNIGKPIPIKHDSRVSIKNDNADVHASNPSATIVQSDIGKPVKIKHDSRVSIKSSNTDVHAPHTSTTVDRSDIGKPVQIKHDSRVSIKSSNTDVHTPHPSTTIARSDIGKPVLIKHNSRVSIKNENADVHASNPSTTIARSDIGKLVQIKHDSRVSIKNDNADVHAPHPSTMVARSDIGKPVHIKHDSRVSIKSGNADVHASNPSTTVAQSDIGKPVQIKHDSRVSIKNDNADVHAPHPSTTVAQSDIGKPVKIKHDSRVSIKSSNTDVHAPHPSTTVDRSDIGKPIQAERKATAFDISINAKQEIGSSVIENNEQTAMKRSPTIRHREKHIRTAENTTKSPTTTASVGKSAAKIAADGVVTAAKSTAHYTVKAHTTAAKEALSQGAESTSFSNDESSPNAEAAAIFAAGMKKVSDPESMISAAQTIRQAPGKIRKNLSGIRVRNQAAKTAVRNIGESAKGIHTAIKQYQRAQYISSLVAQSKGQAALSTTKNVAQLLVNVTENLIFIVINALKTVVASSNILWFAASILVIITITIVAFGSFILSGYGIFFTTETDNTTSIEDVVRSVNNDYQKKIEKITADYDRHSVSMVRYEGSKIQWKYILALYAVKYSSDGEDIITVNEKTEEKIKKIFYKIHTLSADYVTEENPHAAEADPSHPVNPYWEVLVVTTTAKPLSDVMDEMKLNDEQREQVMNIVNSDTDELWIKVLYGHNGNGGQALAKIAKGQIGQTSQTYTSWVDIPSYLAREWSGSFVCWCANEAGYVTQGLYPRSNDKTAIMDWFKDRGLWDNPDHQPNIGDTIFISYKGDGECNVCGIITKISDGNIYYISNVEDIVTETFTDISNPNNAIIGYGILPQMSGLRGDTVESKIYNYLRQEGYSAVSACGVIANIQADCGCDPEQFGKEHDYYTGIFRWEGTEMTKFMDWCSDNAYDWRNLESQLMYYEHWLEECETNGYWGSVSTGHSELKQVTSTAAFKSITESDYESTEMSLYAAAVIFADDIDYHSDEEARRYSYAAEFYNYLVSNTSDGSVLSAWQPEYGAEIGIFHLY